MIYIFWTSASAEEAERIVRVLLERRLIACASLLPKVISLYRWQGEIAKSEEVKVLLKTRLERFDDVANAIKRHCSFGVPEIASIGADRVFEPYLQWLVQETH